MTAQLFQVQVSGYYEETVYVWAPSEWEAERIASMSADECMVEFSGDADSVDFRNAPGEDEQILGIEPDDSEKILRRLRREKVRHSKGPSPEIIVNVPSLFEGCNPTPLPCVECGEHEHDEECSFFEELSE